MWNIFALANCIITQFKDLQYNGNTTGSETHVAHRNTCAALILVACSVAPWRPSMRKENGSATEKVEYCGERKERGQVQDYRASVIESRKLLEMWRPEKTGWMKGKDKTSVISFTLAGTPHTIKAKQTCSECREAAFGIFQQKHGLGLREHLLSQTAAVARGMPRSAFSLSSSLLSLCLALYYQDTVALLPYSTVSHFEMPPNPLVTMRVTATTKKKKKKVSTSIFQGGDFSPCAVSG